MAGTFDIDQGYEILEKSDQVKKIGGAYFWALTLSKILRLHKNEVVSIWTGKFVSQTEYIGEHLHDVTLSIHATANAGKHDQRLTKPVSFEIPSGRGEAGISGDTSNTNRSKILGCRD